MRITSLKKAFLIKEKYFLNAIGYYKKKCSIFCLYDFCTFKKIKMKSYIKSILPI